MVGKNKGGRPLKFKSVEELENRIKEYFKECDRWRPVQVVFKWEVNTVMKQIPYTITGLASFLWTNRQTLINYEEKEMYFDTVKRAKEKVERDMEERAMMWENNATMSIFSLKNNFDWKDKSEVDETIKWDFTVKLPE